MRRLWDQGAPLDERVLRYTAGEDHALDERLVAYDVRASIAHADMLHAQQLLSAADLAAIRAGLGALAALQGPAAEAGSARAWVAAGALSDALDVAASLASWRELPRVTRWLVAASAGGAALAGAAGALVADRAEPGPDS